jgi:hypothetical protein
VVVEQEITEQTEASKRSTFRIAGIEWEIAKETEETERGFRGATEQPNTGI